MGLLDWLRGKKKEPGTGKKKDAKGGTGPRTTDPRAELGQMTYQEAQQAVKPRWQPGTRYRDERVDPLHSKEGAASGNINQVDLLAYEGIKIGDSSQGFFKEAKAGEDVGDAARAIGIDEKDPRLAERSVATSRAAQMMGLSNVIAETKFATHAGKAGTVSEAAPGRSITETRDTEITDSAIIAELEKEAAFNFGDDKGLDPSGFPTNYRKDPTTGKIYRKKGTIELHHHDLKNPKTQKELNDLQWVDAITGQVDRHGGNIFIDPATGAVKGIDNDAAFGSKKSSDPKDISTREIRSSHFAGMPTLIDAATARSIEALDEEDFRKRLAPLLTEAEVEAAVSRLKACKQRIQFLRLAGSVVGEGPNPLYQEWGDKTYEEQTENADTSYLGRAARNYAEAEASVKQSGPRPDLVVETPEQASQWKPKPVPTQIPAHLKPAVEQMPSLLSPTFDRHRGPKPPPKPTAPGPQIGSQRTQKPPSPIEQVGSRPSTEVPTPPVPVPHPVTSMVESMPTNRIEAHKQLPMPVEQASRPPDRPPPPTPTTKPGQKPGQTVPTLKKHGDSSATTPKPPPGVQVSKPPDRPPPPTPATKPRPLPTPPIATSSKPPAYAPPPVPERKKKQV